MNLCLRQMSEIQLENTEEIVKSQQSLTCFISYISFVTLMENHREFCRGQNLSFMSLSGASAVKNKQVHNPTACSEVTIRVMIVA